MFLFFFIRITIINDLWVSIIICCLTFLLCLLHFHILLLSILDFGIDLTDVLEIDIHWLRVKFRFESEFLEMFIQSLFSPLLVNNLGDIVQVKVVLVHTLKLFDDLLFDLFLT